jgi:hypothetical protein
MFKIHEKYSSRWSQSHIRNTLTALMNKFTTSSCPNMLDLVTNLVQKWHYIKTNALWVATLTTHNKGRENTQILIEGPNAAHSQYLFGEKQSAVMISLWSKVCRCLPSFRSHSIALQSCSTNQSHYIKSNFHHPTLQCSYQFCGPPRLLQYWWQSKTAGTWCWPLNHI